MRMSSALSSACTYLPTDACFVCCTRDARWLFSCTCRYGSVALCGACCDSFTCPCCDQFTFSQLIVNTDYSSETSLTCLSMCGEASRQAPNLTDVGYWSWPSWFACPACGHSLEHHYCPLGFPSLLALCPLARSQERLSALEERLANLELQNYRWQAEAAYWREQYISLVRSAPRA